MREANTIAKAIIKLSEPEVGDNVSNLKLQKLLYYSQGFHLALFNRPLFEEDILAWEHGPVVREVYRRYSRFGSGAIPVPEGQVTLNQAEKKLLIRGVESLWSIFCLEIERYDT